MYAKSVKRILDFSAALCAVLVLSPLLLVLTVCGAVALGGNPFFLQKRPGKNEKIFTLVKFRTMTQKTDASGELLSDERRLTGYGRFLRATSLDELPELFNILAGQMALVGPRPLLVQYLPLYSERQHHRHDVRPGLTGLAQVGGRNALSWEEKFELDLQYVEHISFAGDVKILFATVVAVLSRKGIHGEHSATMPAFLGTKERELVTAEKGM